MEELLTNYGLFLAKTFTLVGALIIIISFLYSASKKQKKLDTLEVENLNDKYKRMKDIVEKEILLKKAYKDNQKKYKKSKEREKNVSKTIFVLNFQGNIKATAVASLREEITAIISVAKKNDEVLLRLENSGGLVHEHGLAASQLQRLKDKNIPLTVSIDKVAASGGYMMACVANKIISAPFAIVGSIGVLAQLPNFNRLLADKGIDYEQIYSGKYKRTLTIFGENTKEGREKFTEQIEDTYRLFKEFVAHNRPSLDMDKVATGEHWYGLQALELTLIDEIKTSDDYLLDVSTKANLYELNYKQPKTLPQKIGSLVESSINQVLDFSAKKNKEQDLFK